MIIPFFNKPTVKFYSEFPTLTDLYPIYPSKNYQRKWVNRCAKSFAKYKKKSDGRYTNISTIKCPGIRNIMKNGYIIPSWCDFTIETSKDDLYGFKVYYPTQLEQFLEENNYKKPIISSFNMKMSPLKIPTRDNLKSILKVWIPYSYEIPKGYELMILPVQYDDDSPFTACSGSIEGFQIDLNIDLYWHEINNRVTIPAGTPLCQIIIIKKSNINIEVLPADINIKKRTKSRLFQKFNKFQL